MRYYQTVAWLGTLAAFACHHRDLDPPIRKDPVAEIERMLADNPKDLDAVKRRIKADYGRAAVSPLVTEMFSEHPRVEELKGVRFGSGFFSWDQQRWQHENET